MGKLVRCDDPVTEHWGVRTTRGAEAILRILKEVNRKVQEGKEVDLAEAHSIFNFLKLHSVLHCTGTY